jgi:hypothetical protein
MANHSTRSRLVVVYRRASAGFGRVDGAAVSHSATRCSDTQHRAASLHSTADWPISLRTRCRAHGPFDARRVDSQHECVALDLTHSFDEMIGRQIHSTSTDDDSSLCRVSDLVSRAGMETPQRYWSGLYWDGLDPEQIGAWRVLCIRRCDWA